jgi:ABC-type polysaccharide/polyol phosphate transport system ATPase subunit
MGRNGAGKSTLLKVLAGVTPATQGQVEVRGSVFPMIELNAGLHRDLTGRENVRILGAIMGLSPQEIEARMPQIRAFTELGEWFERSVRQYSSGMLARLGFAVAMNVDASVALVDEVLAVGDIGFQRKCYDRIYDLQSQDKSFLVVSHNPYQLERMCSRVLILEQGECVAIRDAREAITAYYELVNRQTQARLPTAGNMQDCIHRPGTGQIRVTKVEVLDGHRQSTSDIAALDPMTIRINFTASEPIHGPRFSIRIYSSSNVIVTSLVTTGVTEETTFHGDHSLECTIPKVQLMTDTYYLEIKVGRDVVLDMLRPATAFSVTLADPDAIRLSGNMGILISECDWEIS